MTEPEMLERLHQRVLREFVARGQAPTYLDLARAEGLAPEEARQALRDLLVAVPGGWQHPGTDLIVAYPPFNNLPTWHRVTVEGEQKWTAQSGLDALVVTYLFPDKDVEIDSLCPRLRRVRPGDDA